MSIRSHNSRLRKTWLSCGLSIFLLLSCLLCLTLPAHGAQTHGCAPDTPPTVPGTPITSGTVQINEVLTRPNSKWNCSGPSNSWVELYNSQSQPIDLYAQHTLLAINDEQGPDEYILPFGTAIPAKGFLVLFSLEHVAATSIGSVVLAMNNNAVDQVSVPPLQADQSYARIPDGTGNWQIVDQPTIDNSNDTAGQTTTPATALTPTPTPTSTPRGTGSNGSGGSSTPGGLGTQPAWGKVQLPPGVTPTDAAATPADSSTPLSSQPQNPPVAQNGGSNGWQIALIVTFVLLLLGILTWCWRLFRAP